MLSGVYCLGGHGDLLTRLLRGIARFVLWDIRVINLLAKPPDPSSGFRRLIRQEVNFPHLFRVLRHELVTGLHILASDCMC